MSELNSSGKQSRRMAMFGALLLTAVGAVWLAGGFDREPSYQGKPASYWLEYNEGTASSELSSNAQHEAFKAMGKDAVPFLIKTMKRQPPELMRKLDEFAENHNFPEMLKKMLPDVNRTDALRVEAARMIGRIGPEAASAIPDLARLLRDPGGTDELPSAVGGALKRMGEAAAIVLPELCENLKSTNEEARSISARVLGGIGPKAVAAVPVLKAATTTSNAVALRSAEALWRIDQEPNFVLQVYSNLLTSTDSDLRQSTMSSLKTLGPAAKPIAPMIVSCLRDKDEGMRIVAERTLKAIDPDLLQATYSQINSDIPAVMTKIVEAIDSGHVEKFGDAIPIVVVLGPRAGSAVPALLKFLDREPDSIFAPDFADRPDSVKTVELFHQAEKGLALTLGEIGSDARQAVPKLISLLEATNDIFACAFCKALGGIGPEARAAIPALNKLLTAEFPETRLAAAEALSKIAPEQSSNAAAVLMKFKDTKIAQTTLDRRAKDEAEALTSFGLNLNEGFQLRASVALWRMHLEKEPPVAALLLASDAGIDSWKIALLGDIGPEAKTALPELEKSLEPGNRNRRAAAIAIRKIDPEEAERLGLPGTLAIP